MQAFDLTASLGSCDRRLAIDQLPLQGLSLRPRALEHPGIHFRVDDADAADQGVVELPRLLNLRGSGSLAGAFQACAEFVDNYIRWRRNPGFDDKRSGDG
jgi:hypothetical protein